MPTSLGPGQVRPGQAPGELPEKKAGRQGQSVGGADGRALRASPSSPARWGPFLGAGGRGPGLEVG